MIKSTVNIIVVTYNRLKYLKTFIRFLYLSTDYPFKLIVVDNGSTDGSREYIQNEEAIGRVWKHVFTTENLPLAQAFNAGLKESDSEFVVTVADDMIVSPYLEHDWLQIFVKAMIQAPEVGCINFVGCRCIHDKFLRRYDQ